MTTLAILSDLTEAFLLRSMLQASNIPAFIPDENTCQSWGYINAIGGVRVQVPEEFEEEARSILARFKDPLKQETAETTDPQALSPEKADFAEDVQPGNLNDDHTRPRHFPGGGWPLVLLALAVVGVFLALMQLGQEQSDALVEGSAAYNKGNYDLAIADYSKGIRIDSKNERLYFNRGLAYSARGDQNKTGADYDQALADFDQAIQLDPNDADAYDGRGISYQRKGENDKAIADYSTAIQLDPQKLDYYYNRGVAYEQNGGYDEALADFNQATQLDPNDEPSWYNRGLVLQHKGDLDAAIADFSRALQINPRDEDVYVNRAIAYDDKGEFDKAITDETQALQIDPKNEYASVNRGKAYSDKGETDKAMADYSQAIQLDPKDTQAYLNRGDAHADRHEYDKAIADFSAAIQVDPKYGDAYINRGDAHDNKGEYSQAITDYFTAVQLEPQNEDAYNSLAWDLATSPQPNTRDGKRAIDLATKACELSGWKDPFALDTLAAAYAEVGDFESALKWEHKCLGFTGQDTSTVSDEKARLKLYLAHKSYHSDK